MLEMQVMACDRINDGVRKNALQQGAPMTTPNNYMGWRILVNVIPRLWLGINH
jgi:hypothetical protein